MKESSAKQQAFRKIFNAYMAVKPPKESTVTEINKRIELNVDSASLVATYLDFLKTTPLIATGATSVVAVKDDYEEGTVTYQCDQIKRDKVPTVLEKFLSLIFQDAHLPALMEGILPLLQDPTQQDGSTVLVNYNVSQGNIESIIAIIQLNYGRSVKGENGNDLLEVMIFTGDAMSDIKDLSKLGKPTTVH